MSTVEASRPVERPNLDRLLVFVNFLEVTLRASPHPFEFQGLMGEMSYPEMEDPESGVAYRMKVKYRQNNHLGEKRKIAEGIFSKFWTEDSVWHSSEITLDISKIPFEGPRIKRKTVEHDKSAGERTEKECFGENHVEDSATKALEIIDNYQSLQTQL